MMAKSAEGWNVRNGSCTEKLGRFAMEEQGPIEWGLNTLNPQAHVCFLYETEGQLRAVLPPFVRQGLEKNEKVIYIADAPSAEAAWALFSGRGHDLGPYLDRGQLTFLTAEDAYLRSGVFDPDEMIALLKGFTEGALAQGYGGLRVTGEMSWTLRDPSGADRLIEYEARLNDFFSDISMPGPLPVPCRALSRVPPSGHPAHPPPGHHRNRTP